MEFVTYPAIGGPMDGYRLELPAGYTALDVEFWVQPQALKGMKPFFAKYTLTRDRKRYRYTSWSWESTGAEYQEEVVNAPYLTIVDDKKKEYVCDQWLCLSELGG